LFKVFFTATHIFIALAAGLGVALIAGMLTTQNRILALGFAGFLLLLGILEIIETVGTFKSTDFIIPKTAALNDWLCLSGLSTAPETDPTAAPVKEL